jgi:hypothetical protein
MSRDVFARARNIGCMKGVCDFGMAVACGICLLVAPCASAQNAPSPMQRRVRQPPKCILTLNKLRKRCTKAIFLPSRRRFDAR